MARVNESEDQQRQTDQERSTVTLSDALRGDPRERSAFKSALEMLFKSRIGAIGAVTLLIVITVAILAPVIAPYDPRRGEITDRLQCPVLVTCPVFGAEGGTMTGSTQYLLGTDQQGRDILTRLMYGAQVSLMVGISAVLLGAGFGTMIGLMSGYYGRYVDAAFMRVGDVFLAFPFLLLAVALAAVLGTGLFNVILVLSISIWVPFARLMRGNVLSEKENDYAVAAKSIGARESAILLRHLAPNCITPIIILGTFMVAQAIILEAALSFLGLGVGPVRPTWGGMLADGRDYVATAWWLATLPGLSIVVTVLSINLLGDWLRDVLDPRLRNI